MRNMAKQSATWPRPRGMKTNGTLSVSSELRMRHVEMPRRDRQIERLDALVERWMTSKLCARRMKSW